jgi:hypothetical protein
MEAWKERGEREQRGKEGWKDGRLEGREGWKKGKDGREGWIRFTFHVSRSSLFTYVTRRRALTSDA